MYCPDQRAAQRGEARTPDRSWLNSFLPNRKQTRSNCSAYLLRLLDRQALQATGLDQHLAPWGDRDQRELLNGRTILRQAKAPQSLPQLDLHRTEARGALPKVVRRVRRRPVSRRFAGDPPRGQLDLAAQALGDRKGPVPHLVAGNQIAQIDKRCRQM